MHRIYFILEFVFFLLIVATPPPSDVAPSPPSDVAPSPPPSSVASSAGVVAALRRFNEYAKNDQKQQNGFYLHGFCKPKPNKYRKFTKI